MPGRKTTRRVVDNLSSALVTLFSHHPSSFHPYLTFRRVSDPSRPATTPYTTLRQPARSRFPVQSAQRPSILTKEYLAFPFLLAPDASTSLRLPDITSLPPWLR